MEREIVSAKWGPGAKLPTEVDLCARFKASRPAMREALQALKSRGLVESRQGSGSYVVSDPGNRGVREMLGLYSALQRDLPSFLELMDLRLLVEVHCVRQLAVRATVKRLVPLRQCLHQMEIAVQDLQDFGRADISFHMALVAAAEHQLFETIMMGLLPELGLRFALETYTDSSLVKQNLADHRALLGWLELNDAEGAVRCLTHHLLASRRHLELMAGGR